MVWSHFSDQALLGWQNERYLSPSRARWCIHWNDRRVSGLQFHRSQRRTSDPPHRRNSDDLHAAGRSSNPGSSCHHNHPDVRGYFKHKSSYISTGYVLNQQSKKEEIILLCYSTFYIPSISFSLCTYLPVNPLYKACNYGDRLILRGLNVPRTFCVSNEIDLSKLFLFFLTLIQ